MLPLTVLSLAVAFCYRYKTEIENYLPLKKDVLSVRDERQIAKKLAGLLDYQYKYGKIPLGDDCIDI